MNYSVCYSECNRTMLAHPNRQLVESQAQIHAACNPGHQTFVDTRPGLSHCRFCGYRLTGEKLVHGKRRCLNHLENTEERV